MRDDAEYAAGRRIAEVFRSLANQSGLSVRELADLADAHGLPTAIRVAAGKAALRTRGWRMVAARRRLVELYDSAP